jgi:flagellar hook-associated protein 1 FlgK
VSGVSTDEELTHLIEAQSAFSAAARIVTTVDEMMQTLLDIKR